MKKYISIILLMVLSLMLIGLPGCSVEIPEETGETIRRVEFSYPEPVTLRLVLGNDNAVLTSQIQSVAEDFTAMYEYVTIQIETLSDREAGAKWETYRQEEINEIHQEMQAGGGPDLFLMDSIYSPEQVFPDMNEAIRSGCFADLNEYYLADSDLKREQLNTTIMEAGVVDGAQYVLPLRYNFPAVFVDSDRLHEAGLTADVFDIGVSGLLETVVQLGDADVATSISSFDAAKQILNYFPNLIDYDTRQVLIT